LFLLGAIVLAFVLEMVSCVDFFSIIIDSILERAVSIEENTQGIVHVDTWASRSLDAILDCHSVVSEVSVGSKTPGVVIGNFVADLV